MAKFQYESPAKVNLALDILRKDENGYHQLKSVFQEIPFFDEIEIETTPIKTDQSNKAPTCEVTFSGEDLHLIDKKNNTVTKTFEEFEKVFPIKNSYKIRINKMIPIAAGFGGGSGNAGTFLNALYDLEVAKTSSENPKQKPQNDQEKLIEIALRVGADVAFFLKCGTAIGTHYGEILEPLDDLNNLDEWKSLHKILIISSIRANTALMFKRLDLSKIAQHTDQTEKTIEAIRTKNVPGILKNMHNDFELITRSPFMHIQKNLAKTNKATSLLCGSGSSVIAFSNTPFDLEALSQELPHLRILSLPQ
jgi:4-diphosphocytidyl-2-C-methyl-D-erythritol kinase